MSPIPRSWPRDMKPLCWFQDGSMAGYRKGVILKCSQEGSVEDVARLPMSAARKLLARGRLFSRMMRIEPRVALAISDSFVLLTWRGSILSLDLSSGRIHEIHEPRVGFSNPLTFTRGQGDLLAIWGDYGANSGGEVVRLYGVNTLYETVVLHEFPAGAVRHVHGLVRRDRGGYYIFAGDMEPTSGIYVASDDFASVRPLALGEQRYRAVRGFCTEAGLVYATDSASVENHVYLLDEGSPGTLQDLASINGPCIYGGACSQGCLFSTTIEPDERLSGARSALSCRLGPGVVTRESQVLLVTPDAKVREVARFDGESLPLKLLQYSSLQFPDGLAPKGQEVAFARSLRGLDGRMVEIMGEGMQ